jgi:1-acyl-sn-glycerol-3-phosphate acyltransferase
MPNNLDREKAARLIRVWRARQIFHRAEISGIKKIPEAGRAIIVSNHGRLDFDFFILVKLIWDHCHRFPRIMGDRIWFKLPVLRSLFHAIGAVEGTRANAIALLRQDHIVLTYPGGVREIMTSRFGEERIRWEGRTGFAHVAIATQSPVIPVAGKGVNNGFMFVTSGKRLGRLLYQRILRMGPSYADYRDPLTIGLIPFPLPFSMTVHFPFPCKVKYIVGNPIVPEYGPEAADDPEQIKTFATRVEDSLRDLLTTS